MKRIAANSFRLLLAVVLTIGLMPTIAMADPTDASGEPAASGTSGSNGGFSDPVAGLPQETVTLEWTSPEVGGSGEVEETLDAALADGSLSRESVACAFSREGCLASIRQQIANHADTIRVKLDFDEAKGIDSGDLRDYATGLLMEALRGGVGFDQYGDYASHNASGWSLRYSYDSNIDGTYDLTEITAQLHYFTTAAQEAELASYLDEVLATLDIADAPVYDKVKAIHDWICTNVSYDYANLDDDGYTLKHSAYAAAINKTAVCQGYALLFYRMCMEMGVPCRYISGMTQTGELHAWNIVQMEDGMWYCVDTTWDASYSPAIYYDYFLKGEGYGFAGHYSDDEYLTDEFTSSFPISKTDYEAYDPDYDDVTVVSMGDEPMVYSVQAPGSDFQWVSSNPQVILVQDVSTRQEDMGDGTFETVSEATLAPVGVGNAKVTLYVDGWIFSENYFIVEESTTVDIADAHVTGIQSSYEYAGVPIVPSVKVTFDGTVLEEGVDFDLSITGNDAPGDALVTIEGKGSYRGKLTFPFTIVRGDVADWAYRAIPDQVYTGSAIEPDATLEPGFWVVRGEDYDIAYEDNVSAGDAAVVVTGIGDFTGELRIPFTIKPLDIAGLQVLDIPDQPYTGNSVTPGIELIHDGRWLIEGEDYDLSYSDNVKAGTATVTIAGKGNYAGTRSVSFKIVDHGGAVDPDDPSEPDPDPGTVSFTDVFAGVTDHAAHIRWLADEGVSKGWDNGDGTYSYRPYSDVARADMAAFLYRLAGSPSFEPSAVELAAFEDVDKSTPHYKEVLWLVSAGISEGWDIGGGEREFRPYDNIARSDLAALLHRPAHWMGVSEPGSGGRAFSDVDGSVAHAGDVAWLAAAGITTGFPDGTFKPYDTIKRCDMAAMLHRLDGFVEGYGVD